MDMCRLVGWQELCWEDRERVLRLLFAKINNQAQQAYYTNLPPHSFDPPPGLTGVRAEGAPAAIV